MASMNNWLGFSLFPNHQQQSATSHAHQEISDATAATADEGCFDLSSGVSALNQLPPAPFGFLEAFNRDHNQAQDWNHLKESSELSMLIGSSCNTSTHQLHQHHEEPPKLENFLGSSHCFTDNTTTTTTPLPPPSYNNHHHHHTTPNGMDHYNNMFTNPSTTTPASNDNNNGINVSLIKSWLRNQQPNGGSTATTDHNDKSDGGGGGNTLSLSMMSGNTDQSGSGLPLVMAGGGGGGTGRDNERSSSNNENALIVVSSEGGGGGVDASSATLDAVVTTAPKKCIDTFGQRTSIYRGVTRHRWTGRYEAHLWDNSCRREGQSRKGRQVYLGGYDKEEKAARSYDLAAIKYWGTTTTTNFPISNYEKEVEEMKNMTRQEYIASLRRKSSGFSRGASIYRGVTRHHQQGRWQARIGRVAGNKDLYLGTFTTQEEAAEAYDIAAIKFRGLNAVTNFEINRYNVKTILESSTLPIGAAKRLKDVDDLNSPGIQQVSAAAIEGGNHSIATPQMTANTHQYHGISGNYWPAGISFQQAQTLASVQNQHYGYGGQQRLVSWCKQEPESATDTNGNQHHQQNHGFHQDLNSQLQLGNGGQNYLYQYNLMGLDSSSLEHSSGSDSVIYGGGVENGNGVEYGRNGVAGGYGLPMATTVVGHEGNVNGNATAGGGYGESDVNLYYQLSQQSSTNNDHVVKAAAGYDQGSAGYNNWIPTAVPALASKTNNLAAACHGALPFTVWN